MQLLKNPSLKNLNTFAVDVKAEIFAEVFSEDELVEVFSNQKFKNEKIFVLGGGSNVLFTKDYEGLIIKVSNSEIVINQADGNSVLITIGAGVIWDDLVNFCVERNFYGIENLTLIPGSVGAAPVQNIGAYGQELSDTFISLNGVVTESGKRKTFSKSECKFSYRSSIFKTELKNKFVITSIKLKLGKNLKTNTSYKTLNLYLEQQGIKNPTIQDIRNAVVSIRKSRLPDPAMLGNAGSFFKNPEVNEITLNNLKSEFPDIVSFPSELGRVKISAGWLIEKAGWKGKRVGDVGTSPDHALIICNFGNATGTEILEFAMRIKEEVANKFGITLEEEVNIL